ncbi:hypothetical protein K469DRAFT_498910, partial [Zopfia rhizophila CBS 207.26]
ASVRHPETRRRIQNGNPNGNSGRHYFICTTCRENQTEIRSEPRGGWITWDDARGINNANPKCFCKEVSRQGKAGGQSFIPGMGFWTCATGVCAY